MCEREKKPGENVSVQLLTRGLRGSWYLAEFSVESADQVARLNNQGGGNV